MACVLYIRRDGHTAPAAPDKACPRPGRALASRMIRSASALASAISSGVAGGSGSTGGGGGSRLFRHAATTSGSCHRFRANPSGLPIPRCFFAQPKAKARRASSSPGDNSARARCAVLSVCTVCAVCAVTLETVLSPPGISPFPSGILDFPPGLRFRSRSRALQCDTREYPSWSSSADNIPSSSFKSPRPGSVTIFKKSSSLRGSSLSNSPRRIRGHCLDRSICADGDDAMAS